jgi:hypothetical protein
MTWCAWCSTNMEGRELSKVGVRVHCNCSPDIDRFMCSSECVRMYLSWYDVKLECRMGGVVSFTVIETAASLEQQVARLSLAASPAPALASPTA